MGRRYATVCGEPGCPELSVRRGRCQRHARELERPWEQARTARGGLRGYAHSDWRRAALDRAGHRCQRCGTRLPDDGLEVHHLGALDDHDDVVVLCKACHRATYRGGVVELEV